MGSTLETINPKDIDESLLKITEIQSNQEANNSTLTNINTSQKLTGEDIQALKEKGADSSTIIQALIENSSSFHTKTAYSQVKYLKKKMAKHSTLIRVLKPSLKTLCESYYAKDPKKICNLRFDTFGQLLTLANIKAGSKTLVVETTMGLVTGAIAERIQGSGKVLTAFVGKGASLSIAQNFGFTTEVESSIVPFNIELLSQLNVDPTYTPLPAAGKISTSVFNQVRTHEASEILKEGVFSLVIVTKYSPLSILLASLPFLNPSGTIVIFSLYQSHLFECYQFLQQNNLAINLSITEIWMREQQVLPKRTHPTMNMDGASGYMLSGITIAAKAWGPQNSKQRIIALHGWLDNANSFDVIAPVLAEEGFRVICIDFIGHGRSPHKPAWCNIYYTDYITQVVDVADALGWKTFAIIGHSMGAGIGSILAATMPSLVERIVCLDFIGILSREQDQLKAMQHAMQSRERLIKRKPHLYPSSQSIFEKLRSNNPFISEDAARQLLKRSVETVVSPNGDQMYKLRHDPRLVGPSIFTMREHEVLVMLKSIKCPVFLVWGTVSAQQFSMKKNWTEVMEKRMQCVKHLQTINVDGSHHFHMEENIGSFIPQLVNFIKDSRDIGFNPDSASSNFEHIENHNQLADVASAGDSSINMVYAKL
eukprot:gene7215-8379_t